MVNQLFTHIIYLFNLQGTIPNFLCMAIVKSANFNGNMKNPYSFIHANLDTISVEVDGISIPASKPLKADFDENQYVRLYDTLFSLSPSNPEGHMISRSMYSKGFMVVNFNLTQDHSFGEHLTLERKGNCRLSLTFSKALTESITLILYSQFNSMMQVDHIRNIIYDN